MAASDTKLFESSQALFCAVVDYLGKPIIGNKRPPNYLAFQREYGSVISRVKSKVKTGSVTQKNIDDFLTKNKDWYDSSINIANELFRATKTISRKTFNRIKPPGISLFYVRGDKTSRDVMSDVATIWKYTNDYVKRKNKDSNQNDLTFNDLNKWSPADIYLVSQRGKMVMRQLASGGVLSRGVKIGKTKIDSLTNMQSFAVLNALMKQMIKDGDLLPLSLKKAPDQKSVRIKTINFFENDVSKTLAKNNIKYHGYIFSQTKDVFNSKDIYIKVTSGKPKIQFRDKGGTEGGTKANFSYQGIISGGKQALDGSLSGDSIGNVLYQTDPTLGRLYSQNSISRVTQEAFNIAKNMQKEIDDAGTLSRSIQNPICKRVFYYVNRYSGSKYSSMEIFYNELVNHKDFTMEGTRIKDKKNKGSYIRNQLLVDRARAQFLFGKFLGGRLIDTFERKSTKDADNMARNLFLYAGSRTTSSSPHIKASDVSSL